MAAWRGSKRKRIISGVNIGGSNVENRGNGIIVWRKRRRHQAKNNGVARLGAVAKTSAIVIKRRAASSSGGVAWQTYRQTAAAWQWRQRQNSALHLQNNAACGA